MVLLPALSLLSGCALMNLATVKRSHPTHRGRLHVDGISSSVQILRDDLGVPHIQAETENDAWFTLGLVHAQDRLFQADLMRRLAWGDLSEWLGADLVDLGASTLVHPGGQSGHPRHRLYQSHFEAFTTDQTLPLWFAQADVDQHTRWHLILEP